MLSASERLQTALRRPVVLFVVIAVAVAIAAIVGVLFSGSPEQTVSEPYAPYTAGPVVREVPKAPDPYGHYPYR